MSLFREAVRAVFVLKDRLARRGRGGDRGFWKEMWGEAAAAACAELVELGEGFLEIRRGGARTRVQGKHVALDDPVTLRLAGSKPLVHRLLREAGLPVPEHREYALGSLGAARSFLAEHGPCVVKPARGSGAGVGVTTGVSTWRELKRASYAASVFGRELIVEKQIPGDVYRLLFLDGELLDAVRRRVPRVTGDGRSTVRQLIEAANRARSGPSATGGIDLDVDCVAAVKRAGHALSSVLPEGQEIAVKGTSNHGDVRDSESVPDEIGPELRAEARRAAATVGVRLAGVDVITKDPAVPLAGGAGVVLEVNTTPGLQWHYRVRNGGRKVAIPILERLLEEAREEVSV